MLKQKIPKLSRSGLSNSKLRQNCLNRIFRPLFMNKQIFIEQIYENNKAVHSFTPTSILHVFADKLHFSRFSMAAWPGAWQSPTGPQSQPGSGL